MLITAHNNDIKNTILDFIKSIKAIPVLAHPFLNLRKDQLEKLTEALVERETMSDAEIRDLLGFEPYCKSE